MIHDRPRLGQLLVDAGILSPEQLSSALAAQKRDKRRLGTILVELGFVNEIDLTQVLSQQLNAPWVSLHHIDFSRHLLELVPHRIAERYSLIPIFIRHVRGQGNTLYVAMDDPSNEEALGACVVSARLPVRAMIAPPSDIQSAIRAYYGAPERQDASDMASRAPPLPAPARPPAASPSGSVAPLSPPPASPEPLAPPTAPAALPPPVEPAAAQTRSSDPAIAELSDADEVQGELGDADEVHEATPSPPPPRPREESLLSIEIDLITPTPGDIAPQPGPPTVASPHAAELAPLADLAPLVEPPPSEPEPATPPPPSSSPSSPPRPPSERKPTRRVNLTLLDGTTISVPARKGWDPRRQPKEEGSTEAEALTTRDLIAALRAVSHGADASEILGEQTGWEALIAALLSLLLKKHLIADWEFVEEFKKI